MNSSDKKNPELTKALLYAAEHGIIDSDTIAKAVEEMKRDDILSKHPFTIWQNKEGDWLTHIINKKGNRTPVKRKTKRLIEDVVIQYVNDKILGVKIKDVFNIWLSGKLSTNEIKKRTGDKYTADFKRFFNDKLPICRKRIKDITEDELECFIKERICTLHLTRKTYSALRTLIRGVFIRAKKLGHTDLTMKYFFDELELGKSIFTNNQKPKETEVFSEDEVRVVIDYLKSHITIWNMGLLLLFETGLRVGELSGLKPEDIGNRTIKVRRTEIKERNEKGKWINYVSEDSDVKTEMAERNLILPQSAAWTIEQILALNPEPNEFLFEVAGNRIRGHAFNKALKRVCDAVGIPHRSPHKIRKTYGTTLIDSKADEAFIQEQMGHKDIMTTKQYYYFCNKSDTTKREQIDRAINF